MGGSVTIQANGHAPALDLRPFDPAPATPPRQDAAEPDRLRTWCTVALWAIAVLIAAASAASFAESYRGLWLWARHHGIPGVWAAAFPAQVDVFIAVGELALFVALVLSWRRRSRAGAWLVTLAGLAVSVAGNVGHVAGHDTASRVTAGVPPVAATVALAVGLGVLKRLVRGDSEVTPEPPVQATPEPAPSHPQVTVRPVQVAPRRKAQVTPARISDADLKAQIRAALKADPGVTLKALAADLNRGRDRLRPLLDEVRQERES
jgi:hypothetical protein